MSNALKSKNDLRTYSTLILEEFLDGLDYDSLNGNGKVRKSTALKALTNHIRKKLRKLAQE